MIEIAARRRGRTWYAVAWSGVDFVATAVGSNEREALEAVHRCLPARAAAQEHEGESHFLQLATTMLAELEAGDESGKVYALSREHLSPALHRILTAAAAIPIGFVTTYGTLARAVGSEARAVGQAMATNPLYPIVPCHRVVGADFSLVGYGGRQDDDALAAKLARLESEARGETETRAIGVGPEWLDVYPVERVIYATREADARQRRRRDAEAARERDEALQQMLF